jgi:uncharacterized protein involved in outer membrane biogenesis
MNRMMRRLLIAAGIIFGILAALVLLVPMLVPTDTFTQRIEKEVARATGA